MSALHLSYACVLCNDLQYHRRCRYVTVFLCFTYSLTLFRAGRRKGPSGFLCHCQTLQDMQVILGVTFPKYSLRSFQQKTMPSQVKSGQVRSGHQGEFVDSMSVKFAIPSELVFFFSWRYFLSSGLHYSTSTYICVICLFQNLYICNPVSMGTADPDQ